jgi:hypothetical protein
MAWRAPDQKEEKRMLQLRAWDDNDTLLRLFQSIPHWGTVVHNQHLGERDGIATTRESAIKITALEKPRSFFVDAAEHTEQLTATTHWREKWKKRIVIFLCSGES